MKRQRDDSASLHVPWRGLVWAAAVATVSFAGADARSVMRVGNATTMNLMDVSTAGCGFVSWPSIAETHYAAVLRPSTEPNTTNRTRAAKASACGRCARVWCDDERRCGRERTEDTAAKNSAVVYFVEDQRQRWYADAPPTDNSRRREVGDLNLSPQVFQNLTGIASGRFPVRWRFVDCPSFDRDAPLADTTPTPTPTDPLGCAVCVHNASSAYWLALQPVNDTLGVSSLRINGRRATRPVNASTFFFRVADRIGRFNLTRLEISITTRSRRRFKRLVAVQPGSCVGIRRSDELPTSGGGGGDGGSPPNPPVWPPPSVTERPSTPGDVEGKDEDGEKVEDSGEDSHGGDGEDDGNYNQGGEGEDDGNYNHGGEREDDGNYNHGGEREDDGKYNHGEEREDDGNLNHGEEREDDGNYSHGGGGGDNVPMPGHSAFVAVYTDRPPRPSSPPSSALVSSTATSVRSSPPFTPTMASSPVTASVIIRPPMPTVSPPIMPPSPPHAIVPSLPHSSPPIDKEGGIPTHDPSDTGIFGSGSGTRSRSPPRTTAPSPSSRPPLPTLSRTPVKQLEGGVITNPLFVGLLLGTVGLVGAIVAYRAKATQRNRLVLHPPTANAAYTPRTEFASL